MNNDSTIPSDFNQNSRTPRKFQFDLTVEALEVIDTDIAKIKEFEELIARANQQLKALKENLDNRVYSELDQLYRFNPEAGIELATELYWFRENEVKTTPICKALGTYPQVIDRFLPPAFLSFNCSVCGNEYQVEVTTRSKLKSARTPYRCICQKCEAIEQKQRHAQYEEMQRQREAQIYELRTMPYGEYLKTDHWKSLRARMLKRANYSCQLCNASNVSLHVHHRTYENRGDEDYSDLIVLCAPCHSKFHDKLENV